MMTMTRSEPSAAAWQKASQLGFWPRSLLRSGGPRLILWLNTEGLG